MAKNPAPEAPEVNLEVNPEVNPGDSTEETTPEKSPEELRAEAYAALDKIGQALVDDLNEQVSKAVVVDKELAESSSDPNKIADSALDSLRNGEIPAGLADENITPETLAEYERINDQREKFEQYFLAVAKNYGQQKATENTDVEKVNKLTEALKSLTTSVKTGRAYLASKNYAGLDLLIPALPGHKSGSSSGVRSGQGEGGMKLRYFTITLVNGDQTETHAKFTDAAKSLGIPTTELQKAYVAKVGTDERDKFPAEAEFTVKNSAGVDVTVNAKYAPPAK